MFKILNAERLPILQTVHLIFVRFKLTRYISRTPFDYILVGQAFCINKIALLLRVSEDF